MSNLFDSTNYPETEPTALVAGDRVAWKRTDLGTDYSPTLYTLTYTARRDADGQDDETITASASGTDYVIEVAAATTADWTAGTYVWQAYITRDSDSERITIDSGRWEVLANRVSSTADPRSHARKVLDAIESTIEGRATSSDFDVLSYSLPTRSASRDPAELRRWRTHYAALVRAEEGAERIKNGGHDGTLVRTRMQA